MGNSMNSASFGLTPFGLDHNSRHCTFWFYFTLYDFCVAYSRYYVVLALLYYKNLNLFTNEAYNSDLRIIG